MKRLFHKNAIALLITVFFIMLITVSLGVGLKQMKEGNKSMGNEQFIFQSRVIIEDVLKMLQTSKDLEKMTSAAKMRNFLLHFEYIWFENNGLEVSIKLSSARSKINPNTLNDKVQLDSFKEFLLKKGINTEYADFLLDAMSGMKEDETYITDIFNQNPTLFREYISSQKHLKAIGDLYVNYFHDSNFKNFRAEEVFYPSKDSNSSIDLNFASASTYEIILGCDEIRAQELSESEKLIDSLLDLQLSDEEKLNIKKFKTSFFQAILDVNIELKYKGKRSKIRFEYNVKSKKGSHFVFEV